MALPEAIFKLLKPRRKASGIELTREAMANIPRHVAVIMDGNGRWARKRGLPRRSGHSAGAENLHEFCQWCIEFGISYTTVFAFSTENWQRPQQEVDSLMKLFVEFFARYEEELAAEGVRLRFCGEIAELPQSVQETMRKAETSSLQRNTLQLVIAFNYGGRREIVKATRELLTDCQAGELEPEELTEEHISARLYLPDVPDPDLIIRPSGELRLSNFLLWQSAYSEFWFAKVLWPDFSRHHFIAAINDYASRQRRYGGLSKEERGEK
ncbi:MAG: isoprenyl transferase [Clostridiaceae bacterium]|jgi:undecaprenyl diphosphate synthase|nr:isoprenyl transferase [Clostridiaceae bacterium]